MHVIKCHGLLQCFCLLHGQICLADVLNLLILYCYIVEPCILVMYHSMRPHPAITATLLDFMCRIMSNFYPPMTTQVKKGIFTALRSILDKRVLQSLGPLFDNGKLDRELRTMIRENFSEFCSLDGKIIWLSLYTVFLTDMNIHLKIPTCKYKLVMSSS